MVHCQVWLPECFSVTRILKKLHILAARLTLCSKLADVATLRTRDVAAFSVWRIGFLAVGVRCCAEELLQMHENASCQQSYRTKRGWTPLSHVGTTINHPFGNGLDQLSMVIWGMVYKCCYTHIADLLELRPAFHADCKATWQTDWAPPCNLVDAIHESLQQIWPGKKT